MNVCFWHDLGRTQYTEMRTSLEAETACLCVYAQVGQEERLQLQVTRSSCWISDGQAGHW